MAARGTVAKQNVINQIAEAFGQNYVGEYDKKLYVIADDGGSPVQIAISLTCPKVEIAVGDAVQHTAVEPGARRETAVIEQEMTAEEKETIKTLFERLGL